VSGYFHASWLSTLAISNEVGRLLLTAGTVMLIFTKNAFISIVAHTQDDRFLTVRGRIAGDIEKVFPEAEVFERPGADFRFQANIGRDRVAQRLSIIAKDIHYEAFETAVEDPERRQAYFQVWSAMYEEQARREEKEQNN